MYYSINEDNNIAVHSDKDAAIKEVGASGAAFATEAKLSEATTTWPAARLVEIWNSFAGAPPFADLKEVKKFTDRKAAVQRIWAAAQRLGSQLEKELEEAPAAKGAKRAKAAKVAPTKATQPPAARKVSHAATSPAAAPAANVREGTAKANVIALLQRDGGATLDEIRTATGWQPHTVRGFISILGSRHGFKVTSTRREEDKARLAASTA